MSDSFQYRVGFDADTSGLDQAAQATQDLLDSINDLGSSTIEIDTDEATRAVQQLVEDVDKLSSQDAVIQLTLARNDIATQVADIAETIEKLDASDPEIDLKMAQGDVLLDQIETIDAKLRSIAAVNATPQVDLAGGGQVVSELGDVSGKLEQIAGTRAEAQVELSNSGQVIGDLDQVEAKVRELDGQTAEVRIDTTGATQGVDRISDSARGANSALANMVGNSAQDIGNLGGISQSAGVAIGQMAEYASDARLAGEGLGSALSSMAAVAGPIAGIAVATSLIGNAMAASKKRAEELNASISRFTEGMADAVGAAEQMNSALDAAFDVGAASEVALVTRAFTDALNPAKVQDYQQALAELSMTGENFVQEFQLAGGTFDQFTKRQAFAAGATTDVIEELATLVQNFDGYTTILSSASDSTADFIRQNQALVTGLDDMGSALGGLSLENLARNFLEAQKGVASETEAIDDAIASTLTYTDALQEYLQWKQRQNAVQAQARSSLDAERTMWESITQAQKDATAATQEAQRAQEEALSAKALQDQVTMLQGIADETDRVTFTQQELAAALRATQDPLQTLPATWATLINDFRDGNVDVTRAVELINELAAATGREPGDIFQIITQQAVAANEAVSASNAALGADYAAMFAGIAQAEQKAADEQVAQAKVRADAVRTVQQQNVADQVTMFESIAQAEQEAADKAVELAEATREAGVAIGHITDQVPDVVGDLSTEFGKINDLFDGLSFDVDFKPALATALDDLNSFKPDLQTTADEWAEILKGKPIDIFGNVRADDAEFMEKLGNLRTLFQQGVVNEFEQGGIQAANTFVQSAAARIANSTELSIGEVYRIMGLGPDGSVTALIQPEISAQHADQARAVLDAIAGTSDDPRIAQLQVQLETGQIDGDLAYVESLLLARELGIPVTLDGIPQADIDAAQAALDANPVTLATRADTTGAVADIDGIATQEHVATILAHADTDQANADLDGVAAGDRAANHASEGGRTATILAEAKTDAAASEIATFLAQPRTFRVDGQLGKVPSASNIIAAIGSVRVPIDYYVRSDPRVNGSRLAPNG